LNFKIISTLDNSFKAKNMITYIKINGFKSFQNFEMEFTPLTVIAGTNASGKSNLFDALKLLSKLAESDLKTAFADQRGNADELFTQIDEDRYCTEMEFVVDLLVNRIIRDNWGGEEKLNNTRLRYKLVINRKNNDLGFEDLFIRHESLEKIRPDDDLWIKKFKQAKELAKTLKAGGSREPFIQTIEEGNTIAIRIRQDGKQGGKATPANTITQTVLGGIVNVDFRHVFAVKEEMRSWKFLQLNPSDLREPTKQEPGLRDQITSSGKNLASALYRISQSDSYILTDISRKLNEFLPDFVEVKIYDDRANRQYLIKLKGADNKEYSSRVLSEGTLRILALCILQYDEKHMGLLCFEEPENGIHPFRIKSMLQLLKDLASDFNDWQSNLKQVIVNTHSPVLVSEIVNWRKDSNVSVHFSQIRTRIMNIGDSKKRISVTKITPVIKDVESQKQIEFSEQDIKLTISTVKEYLQSVDSEKSKSFLNSL
jgi:predicted ATPase